MKIFPKTNRKRNWSCDDFLKQIICSEACQNWCRQSLFLLSVEGLGYGIPESTTHERAEKVYAPSRHRVLCYRMAPEFICQTPNLFNSLFITSLNPAIPKGATMSKSNPILNLRKHIRCFSSSPSLTLIRDGGWKQMLNLSDVQWSKLSLNPNLLNILVLFEIADEMQPWDSLNRPQAWSSLKNGLIWLL